MTSTADRDARLYLLRVAEHPSRRVHAYVAEQGAVRAAADIRDGTAPILVRLEAHHPERSIDSDLSVLDTGRSLLSPDQAAWAGDRLAALPADERPFALWVRGNASLAELSTRAVTITGARAATSYGSTVAADFATAATQHGVTVINGGAYGIDEAALRATIAARGRGIVILPCGIDLVHPQANAALFDLVVEHGGLVVSEYAPGCVPTRARRIGRCRLLAALSSVTLIVEAGRRSGAISVADTATQCGRSVLGVPGSIFSAMSAGVHDMIRAGTATVVTKPEDMLGAATDPHDEI